MSSSTAPPPAKKAKKAKTALAADADTVLKKVRELRVETAKAIDASASSSSASSADYGGLQKKDLLEVENLNAPSVMEKIELIAMRIAKDVLEKNHYTFTVPSRASSNQHYIKSLDRIVLGNASGTRTFASISEVRKTTITARCMELIHNVLGKGIHITKRDLFYTDVKLFVKQADSDGVLDDISTMVGCTRSNLNVVASDKGLVVGRVQFTEDGDPIDCTRMGVGGKAIPPYTDKITDIQSDAEFVLLVEKDAVYMRLAEDRFYHRYPCIIITAKVSEDQ